MKALGTQAPNEAFGGDTAAAPILDVSVYVSNVASRRSEIPEAAHLPSLEGRLRNQLVDHRADISIRIIAALGDRIPDRLAQGFEFHPIVRAEFSRSNDTILNISQNGRRILLGARGPVPDAL